MNIEEYRSKLKQFENVNSADLIDFGKWVGDEALPWLWDEFAGVILTPKPKHSRASNPPLPPKLKPMKHDDAVRQGIFTSAADWDKKRTDPLFYQAQLTMLDAEAKRYCAVIVEFAKATDPQFADATVHTLHRALLEMMELANVLLEDAGSEVAGVPGYFAAWQRQYEHPFEVFKGAEQIIYGTYSGLTHADRAPYIPVAVLRTAIELRLRHAFGVYSLIDKARPEAMVPIDLSKIFEAIQTQMRQHEINFEVEVHDVWKIYRWSNYYLHGGVRDFPWVPGFLLQYLRPIFAGSQHIDGGIRMKREAWRAVRDALKPSLEKSRIALRLAQAWRALFADPRQLELPAFDENDAQCVFLD